MQPSCFLRKILSLSILYAGMVSAGETQAAAATADKSPYIYYATSTDVNAGPGATMWAIPGAFPNQELVGSGVLASEEVNNGVFDCQPDESPCQLAQPVSITFGPSTLHASYTGKVQFGTETDQMRIVNCRVANQTSAACGITHQAVTGGPTRTSSTTITGAALATTSIAMTEGVVWNRFGKTNAAPVPAATAGVMAGAGVAVAALLAL